jgi:hypothetical protein
VIVEQVGEEDVDSALLIFLIKPVVMHDVPGLV